MSLLVLVLSHHCLHCHSSHLGTAACSSTSGRQLASSDTVLYHSCVDCRRWHVDSDSRNLSPSLPATVGIASMDRQTEPPTHTSGVLAELLVPRGLLDDDSRHPHVVLLAIPISQRLLGDPTGGLAVAGTRVSECLCVLSAFWDIVRYIRYCSTVFKRLLLEWAKAVVQEDVGPAFSRK